MPLPPVIRTRLVKAAVDTGFDVDQPGEGEWLPFGSSLAPLRIWLSALSDGILFAAFSRADVYRALDGLGTPFRKPLPPGAAGGRGVPGFPELHRLLRRAFQLSRSLPDEPLHAFERRTAGLPRTTEAERLVVQRVGQDVFRAGLLDYWEGRCAVTGLAVPELLRASHIKPWADCETDRERLDVFNGLLLAAHLDATFDAGLVTVADDGLLLVSPRLPPEARALLGLSTPARARVLTDAHRAYLRWHRERRFRGGGDGA